jgi:hypothetical protein
MSEDVNLDEVMSRRFELDEQITAIQNKNKAELAPLLEELQLCESFVKAELIKTGAQQWKSSSTGHMTYWTTKDSVTVEDMDQVIHRILIESPPPDSMDKPAWDEVLNHIQETGLWALLNKAVNKTTTREVLESGGEVPGVKLTSFRDLAWRRGRA